ncbi:hypothetical protein ACFSLT_17640 [Novosphingobium resinovorum]
MEPAPLLSLSHVRREYPSGDGVFAALKDIDLTIEAARWSRSSASPVRASPP